MVALVRVKNNISNKFKSLLLSVRQYSGQSIQNSTDHFIIWGANTAVGKTLVAAGLAQQATKNQQVSTVYLKPVQTGYPEDSDSRVVYAAAPQIISKTLFTFQDPVSPHLAALKENKKITDEQLINTIIQEINQNNNQFQNNCQIMMETAGGPASPSISGTLQVDLYSALKIPGILIGSSILGGISATISAFETLNQRGHEIPLILTMESENLDNLDYLKKYFQERGGYVKVMGVGKQIQENQQINDWLEKNQQKFLEAYEFFREFQSQRKIQIQTQIERGMKSVWWPFTQHGQIDPKNVTQIGGRNGEFFSIYKLNQNPQNLNANIQNSNANIQNSNACIQQQELYDGCASWWTQGVSSQILNQELIKSMSYAGGRFGHVIFPGNIHQPALELTEKILQTVGKNWATRVFYSDNGSTAVEVALKMAFRKYWYDNIRTNTDNNNNINNNDNMHALRNLGVIVIEGNYHGDTLGAMDCQEEGDFTGPMQTPWHVSRGLTLKPNLIGLKNGKYYLFGTDEKIVSDLKENIFENLDQLFDDGRLSGELAQKYYDQINQQISENKSKLGACIIEPVMQGAGGMNFIDPLFQKVLVKICRERKIPVIFDEVFTGLWRLGSSSGAELLNVKPDIGCYAKLLTGGLIPMAVTLSSESVFDSFMGETKVSALLHGHSYTAHPVGCQIATKMLDLLQNPIHNMNIVDGETKKMGNLWDQDMVKSLSVNERVSKVVALGCVLAVTLKAGAGEVGGYHGNQSANVIQKLRQAGIYARPLGNVVYLMCTPFTNKKTCDWLLSQLIASI